MKTAELRQKFLDYFQKHKHTIIESSSLIPSNDPSLLFTNAGMVQFKDIFLGKEKREYVRATSTQKCVRAGGKHNDLENVGFTARHHTFFEMLGNFSFGDYFKKEAIHMAWEFITKELKLPEDRIYITVFRDDDEAEKIWCEQEKIPKDRIFRFGEKDNFWSMGDTGPCGPCSEIFYDRGEGFEKINPKNGIESGSERYMEIWNLVFMQFNRDSSGKLTPLPKPSVDTGMGLERTASILQNVDSNYEIDLFENLIQKIARLANSKYKSSSKEAVSYRVVADHSRAITFLIADGVLPSNEGRGYVLRRIIRRAIRHGKKIGFKKPFLYQSCKFVIEEMQSAFPDLKTKKTFIEKAVKAEEEQFFRTLEKGLILLDEEIHKLDKKKILPGKIAFKLYDTFGFPVDLTRIICAEKGIEIDEPEFEKNMTRQRSNSRRNWKGTGDDSVQSVYFEIDSSLTENKQKFTGYDSMTEQSKCLALLLTDQKGIKKISEFAGTLDKNQKLEAVFDRTPFYAEGGGQTGDKGSVKGDRFESKVIDSQKPTGSTVFLALKPHSGKINIGQSYQLNVDADQRRLTTRNHTATHLMHWALHKVLGDHVKQAGSLVTSELLRFDFTHFEGVTGNQLSEIENLVNQKIWDDDPVIKQEMDRDQAEKKGAIAFFGEKYGKRVRVISVRDYSVEFCGGTHVDRSSDIQLFKIISESSIASGVRRIVAYTSKGAFQYLNKKSMKLKELREKMRASSDDDVLHKIDKLLIEEKKLKKEITSLQSKEADSAIDDMIDQGQKVNGVILITGVFPIDSQGAKKLREYGDQIRNKIPNAVLVLGMKDPENKKAHLLAAIGPKAKNQYNANELIKDIAPLIEGRGGGKSDLAQAGGTNPEKLEEALEKAKKIIGGK